MRVQPINYQKTNLRKRRNHSSSEFSGPIILGILLLLLPALALFGIVNLRVAYNQEADRLNRIKTETSGKLHQLDRELELLRVEKEKFSRWPHIQRKIVQFGLALRPADYRQVKILPMQKRSVTPVQTEMAAKENTSNNASKHN